MVNPVESFSKAEYLSHVYPLVLVECYMIPCRACEKYENILEEASKDYDDVQFLKVNIDDDVPGAMKYQIAATPTTLVFSHGKLAKTVIGQMTRLGVDNTVAQYRAL